jgi:hypothetical protein
MIVIVLLDRQGSQVAKLKVDIKRVADAGLIVYRNLHYAYGGLYAGPLYKFNEVSAPADISDAETV